MFDKDLYDNDYVAAWDDFCEGRVSEGSVAGSPRQGSRPDACRRAAIMVKKIESARQMMAAFGHKVNF